MSSFEGGRPTAIECTVTPIDRARAAASIGSNGPRHGRGVATVSEQNQHFSTGRRVPDRTKGDDQRVADVRAIVDHAGRAGLTGQPQSRNRWSSVGAATRSG